MDTRIKPVERKIILEITDNTAIPFSNKDLEWIAEMFEDVLQRKFDVRVENIIVEGKD